MGKLLNISDLSNILGLVDPKTNKPLNYVIRFWETKFKQIRPKIFNGKRRYYDEKSIEIIKKVHFLLKNKGMTINGVKKFLDEENSLNLDETLNQSIRGLKIKNRLTKISNIVKSLKK